MQQMIAGLDPDSAATATCKAVIMVCTESRQGLRYLLQHCWQADQAAGMPDYRIRLHLPVQDQQQTEHHSRPLCRRLRELLLQLLQLVLCDDACHPAAAVEQPLLLGALQTKTE